jgi:transposase InsO family protein
MEQIARNVTDESTGCLPGIRYVLHDRDTKFCASFDSILAAAGVKPLKLPARSPNLNAFAERWVRSAKEECLSKLILFGEGSLKRALSEFVDHFHAERPHQGKGNVLLFPSEGPQQMAGAQIVCRQRIGGLLRYYYRAA